jgi:hypothetical protein
VAVNINVASLLKQDDEKETGACSSINKEHKGIIVCNIKHKSVNHHTNK